MGTVHVSSNSRPAAPCQPTWMRYPPSSTETMRPWQHLQHHRHKQGRSLSSNGGKEARRHGHASPKGSYQPHSRGVRSVPTAPVCHPHQLLSDPLIVPLGHPNVAEVDLILLVGVKPCSRLGTCHIRQQCVHGGRHIRTGPGSQLRQTDRQLGSGQLRQAGEGGHSPTHPPTHPPTQPPAQMKIMSGLNLTSAGMILSRQERRHRAGLAPNPGMPMSMTRGPSRGGTCPPAGGEERDGQAAAWEGMVRGCRAGQY